MERPGVRTHTDGPAAPHRVDHRRSFDGAAMLSCHAGKLAASSPSIAGRHRHNGCRQTNNRRDVQSALVAPREPRRRRGGGSGGRECLAAGEESRGSMRGEPRLDERPRHDPRLLNAAGREQRVPRRLSAPLQRSSDSGAWADGDGGVVRMPWSCRVERSLGSNGGRLGPF